MNTFVFKYTIILLTLVHFFSCTREEREERPDTTPIQLTVVTKATTGQLDGVVISKLRIIAIDGNGKVVFNKTTGNGLNKVDGTDNAYSITLPGEGSYTIHTIANETSAMAAQLDVADKKENLDNIKIQGNFTKENIPLYKKDKIVVKQQQKLETELERTQCKISLYLRKKTDRNVPVTITKVEVCQYPEFSYLIPQTDVSIPLQIRAVFDNPTGLSMPDNIADGNEDLTSYTQIYNTDNLFPEVNLVNPSDETKAVYLRIYAKYNNTTDVVYTVKAGNDPANRDYNISRGTDFRIYGTIKSEGESVAYIYMTPEWKTTGVPGGSVVPYLNISELTGTITITKHADGSYETTGHTFYFWTNSLKDNVEIDTKTGDIALFDTSLTFRDETTDDNGNSEVAGYVTITPKDPDNFTEPEKDYTVSLKTAILKRSLTLKVRTSTTN